MKWRQLKRQVLAVMEGRGRLRSEINSLCEKNPDGLEIRLECTSLPQLIEACVEGDFVGILPEIAGKAVEKAGLERCRVKELEDVRIELVLMWNETVVGFRSEVADVIQRLAGGGASGMNWAGPSSGWRG